MAYFNHAFCKVMWAGGGTGYINNPGDNSVDLLGLYGVGAVTFADQATSGWPSVSVAPTGGEPLTLVATSLYQNDKVGPFHGGYQETTKSKMINPKFINQFYRVDSNPGTTHIIGVGSTPNVDLANCCPSFFCDETYEVRFDLKGSPALRVLNHNAYEIACAYTGCCDGPVPELVDPALVMQTWMNYVVQDPILFGVSYAPGFTPQTSQRLVNVGFTVTCDGGTTWDLYLPDNLQAGVAGVYFEADGTTLTAAGTAFQTSLEGAITGTVATFDNGTLVGGTGYVDALDVPTTGGTGTGLTVDITTAAGAVTVVAVNNPGSGYTIGDVITITGGGADATIEVLTIQDLSFGAVLPSSSYTSTFDPAAPNCCAGIVMESAFVETKFADCTFQVTDHYEVEPLLIQASMLDNTGDPCVFDQLCISDGITPSGANSQTVMPAIQFGLQPVGTGECVLRELVLSESYQQNYFANNDLRIREITQGNDMTAAVDRNILYTCYYIKHTVPRYNNPSGTFDNDQYLLLIPMTAADAAFESFITTWMSNAGNPTVLEVF